MFNDSFNFKNELTFTFPAFTKFFPFLLFNSTMMMMMKTKLNSSLATPYTPYRKNASLCVEIFMQWYGNNLSLILNACVCVFGPQNPPLFWLFTFFLFSFPFSGVCMIKKTNRSNNNRSMYVIPFDDCEEENWNRKITRKSIFLFFFLFFLIWKRETETKRIDSPATAISQVPVPVSRTISVYDGKVKTLNFRLFSVLYVEDGIFFQ